MAASFSILRQREGRGTARNYAARASGEPVRLNRRSQVVTDDEWIRFRWYGRSRIRSRYLGSCLRLTSFGTPAPFSDTEVSHRPCGIHTASARC
jgi:hypothetical protein